jgi:uncharacterized membrane protein (DUF485 family)
MSKSIKKVYEEFTLKHSSLSIIMIYNVVTALVFMIFYYLIPILMGYAPNFIESSTAIGASYNIQFIYVIVISLIISTVVFSLMFRGMNKWEKVSFDDEVGKKIIKEIDEKP